MPKREGPDAQGRRPEIPPEPLEIREEILRQAREWGDLEKAHVWTGNMLQSYLWSRWRERLREEGYTWQRFLSAMRLAATSALWWVEGRISWEDFVRGVWLLVETRAEPGRVVRRPHRG